MRKLGFVLALSIALWATTASAAIVTYTSEPAWQTAVGSLYTATEQFNNSGLQPFTGVITDVGHIRHNQWRDRVTRSGLESTTFSYLPGTLLGAGGYWDTLPSDYGQHLVLKISLSLPGVGTETVAEIGPIVGFFGWTSTEPFDYFAITAGDGPLSAETFDLDNLQFASKSPVATPEPGTLALVGSGLVGLGALRRKWLARRPH